LPSSGASRITNKATTSFSPQDNAVEPKLTALAPIFIPWRGGLSGGLSIVSTLRFYIWWDVLSAHKKTAFFFTKHTLFFVFTS
jgi:hypothetical protein